MLAVELFGIGGEFLSWLLDVAEDLGRLAIYVALGAAALRLWQRTLGRRRELAARLTDLSPLMQVERFVDRLGVPAIRDRGQGDEEDLVWVHPDAFVRAIAVLGTVEVFAVTTRNRWFRPTFFGGLVISDDGRSPEITLGKTTFGNFSSTPVSIYGGVGARRWGYSELHYHGNPGGYMSQILAVSDAGWIPEQNTSLLAAMAGFSSPSDEGSVDVYDALGQLPQAVATRRDDAVINTIAITKPGWQGDAQMLGLTPGADKDLVRVSDLLWGRRRTQGALAWLRQRRQGA